MGGPGQSFASQLGTAVRSLQNDNFVTLPSTGPVQSRLENPDMFAYAYPTLFPFGCGHPRVTLSLGKFKNHVRCLLLASDRRFSSNPSFHFMTLSEANTKEVMASARFSFKASSINELIATVKATDFQEAVKAIDEGRLANLSPSAQALMKRLTLSTRRVLGSSSSKQLSRFKLFAMQLIHGFASFFVTLNLADVHNPLLMRFCGVDIPYTVGYCENLPSSAERLKLIVDDQEPASNVILLLGEGGTGKSKIIQAIDEYFKSIREHPAMASTAGTGAAAFAIHGTTVHSFLGLCSQNPNMDKIRSALRHIESLILDEAFTIGLTLLSKISATLQSVTDSDMPFGGLVLLLSGDPLQFEPVIQVPLFAPIGEFLVSKSTGKKRKMEEVQSLSAGAALINAVKNAVILYRQWRIECPILLRILHDIRNNASTQEDVDALNGRFIGRLSKQEIAKFNKATVVVEGNEMRQRFNTTATLKFLQRHILEDNAVTAVASDTIAKSVPDLQVRRLLLQLHDTSFRMPGIMKLAKGVPVLIRENVYQSIGVCNGAIGYVSILPPGIPYVGVFFKHLADYPPFIDGFPQGVVPITRSSCSFDLPGNSGSKVSRTQFPFCPAFALTCHAVQGRTLKDGMICQIETSNKHYIYVSLSRIQYLAHLVLLNELTLEQLSKAWNPQLKTFMARIKVLDIETRSRISSKYNDILQGISQ